MRPGLFQCTAYDNVLVEEAKTNKLTESLVSESYLAQLGLGFPKVPKAGAIKIAFLAVSASGFVLLSMYQSMISASMAVKIFKRPVNSLDDIPNFPHSLAVSNGSSVHTFLNSFYGQLSGKVKPGKKDAHWINEALQHGSSDVLFGVYQPIQLYKEYPCLIGSVPVDYRKIGNGLIFQKNWPYTKLINYHLYKVRKAIV